MNLEQTQKQHLFAIGLPSIIPTGSFFKKHCWISRAILASLILFLGHGISAQNPITGSQGFQILSEGNFTFNGGSHVHGPLGIGGNFIINTAAAAEVNMDPLGTYVFPGDGSATTGLLVKGSVTWTTGYAKVLNSKMIHIGSSTGSASGDNGNNSNTQVYPSSTSYNNAKRIEGTIDQTPSPAVFQAVGFDFTGLFNTYRSYSDAMASCANNVQLYTSSGTAISGNNVTSAQNVKITSLVNGSNYLDLSTTSLNNITSITFEGTGFPSSTKLLVITVPLTANFVWNNSNMAGIGGAQGPYIIWNFTGATTYNLTINTASLVVGTVYAPNHNLIKTGTGDIDGNIVAKTITLGLGEVHYFPFNGTLTMCCSSLTAAGTIGSNQTGCSPSFDPALLTETTAPSGGSGTLEYQWQSSANNSTWTDISGATSQTYNPPAISATTYYRRGARRSGCSSYLYSASVTMTVNSPPTINTHPVGGSICTGGTFTLSINAPSNPTLQWQSSADNVTFTNISGATSNNYTTPALNSTTYYRVLVTSNGCSITSNTATVTVVADPFITVQPASANICSGSTRTLSVAATGGTPSFSYQWQSSTDNVTFNNISGATLSSYTTPALTSTNYYRVVVSASGNGCGSVTSSVATISVSVCVENCTNGVDDDADGLVDCNDPGCSRITLSSMSVGPCINHPLEDVATLSVNVAWTTPPPNDSIQVTVYGKTKYIGTGSAAGNVTLTFNIAADGSVGNIINATWRKATSLCPRSANYNAPASCSGNSICGNILYLCGQDKPYDGDAWDHGFINYLDKVNGTYTVTPILTKPDATGYGTYDPMNPSTFVNVNFSNYNLIVVSATTEAFIASALVSYLKDTPIAVINSNYLINNELGLTSGTEGYQFQSHAYTSNTVSKEIYDYEVIAPYYSKVMTKADVLAGGDGYLWANANNQTPNTNSILFFYNNTDALPGVAVAHGDRVFLGYHMNGIYAGAETGYVLPAPVSSYLDPIRHFTLDGKFYFDQALVLAASEIMCGENCTNGTDDDGDGLADCNDTDCKPEINYAIADCQSANADIDLTVVGNSPPHSYRWSDMTAEALWQFNNSTADGSGNSHNQTGLTGTAAYDANDKIEGSHSFNFNGSTFIRYGVDGGFLETSYSARTYSFWVKPTNLTGIKILFEQGGSTAGMACRLNGSALSAAYRASGTQYTTGTLTFPNDGKWHHVAVVFNSGTLTCYLDGVASTNATSANTTIAANTNNDAIGARNGTDAFNSSAANFYNGKMDDLRLFYSALSAQRIADLARNDGDRLNLTAGTYTVTVTNAQGCTATKSIVLTIPCVENCTNGVDDDGDALVDCADPACLSLPVEANTPTHRTIANGSWSSPAVWQGGVVPSTTIGTGMNVLIEHSVLSTSEIKIQGGGKLYIKDGKLTVNGVNLIVENGSAILNKSILYFPTSGNLQLTTSSAYFKAANSQLTVGQNFQNSNGKRVLENVCMTVNEVFSNSGGTDSLSNVCAVIGVNSSGNFANNSGSMFIFNSEFKLPNGNFQNQSGATLAGTNMKVWVQNGNFQNSGTWTATVTDYCVSGSVTVSGTYLPAVENCTTISNWFTPCDCNCAPNLEVCENGIDDDGDGQVDCADNSCNLNLVAVASPDTAVCSGFSTVLTASSTGGLAPYSFSWSNSLGSGTTKTVSPTTPTTYTVTVTAGYGCTATDQVVVSIDLCNEICTNGIDDDNDGLIDCSDPSCTLSAPAITGTSTICYGTTTTLTASSGSTYLWGTGETSTSINVSPLVTTTYSVTATNAGGCTATAAITVTLIPCPEICDNSIDDDGDGLTDCDDTDCIPDAYAGSDVSICSGFSTTLNASATGGTQPYTFVWDNGLGQGVSHTVWPTATTNYSLMAVTPNGCVAFDSVLVTVTVCTEICGDGIDNDNDGILDCADIDCAVVGQPNLANDVYQTCPGVVFVEQPIFNDLNLQYPTYSIATNATRGNVTINFQGIFTYTPTLNTCGVDSFKYQVCNLLSGCCDIATVVLNIGDNAAPILTNVPADMTIECNIPVPAPALVLGLDNCPGIFVNFDEVSNQVNEGSCDNYTIVRTWQATDKCGNSTSATQTITVEDTSPPELFRVYTLPNGKKLLAGIVQKGSTSWQRVKFPINFPTTPLVFSQVVTKNGPEAVITRHRNINYEGFDLRIQEEESANGIHALEQVAWMAIEAGTITGTGGLQAGMLSNVNHNNKLLTYSPAFATPPALIASVQTYAEADPVQVRCSNSTAVSTQLKLEEEKSQDNETNHANEILAYLAVTAGNITDENGDFVAQVGTVSMNNNWQTIYFARKMMKPVVLFGGQPTGNDPATIRVRNVTATSFEARIEEWDYLDGTMPSRVVSYFVVEGSVPATIENPCEVTAATLIPGINLIAVDNCDNQVSMDYTETMQVTTSGQVFTKAWITADDCGNVANIMRNDTCKMAAVRLRGILHGAMIGNGSNAVNMRDNLRTKGYLPSNNPIELGQANPIEGGTGGEVLSPAIMNIAGDSAVVDWMLVEIRDAIEPQVILLSVPCILQRDGDIVMVNGNSIIELARLEEGYYHVRVKHRSHLGIMTESPVYLSIANPPMIDFTLPTVPVFGSPTSRRLDNGRMMMWGGDYNADDGIIYQGPNNDVFKLFTDVLTHPLNTNNLANFIRSGYENSDMNMDGNAIYQGPGNDRSMLLLNSILAHPLNTLLLANFIAYEVLP